MRQIEVQGVCRGAFAEDDVNGVVLHRGVQNLLVRAVQAVYLIDKKNVPLVEIGEHGDEITRLFDSGAGGNAHIHAHLVCDNGGKRGFAKPRRAVQQYMVKRLVSHFGRVNENAEIFLGLFLPYIFVYGARSERTLAAVLRKS